MKKILAICSSPDQGGLELYFISLVNYFIDKGNIYSVTLDNSFISHKIKTRNISIKKNNFLNIFQNVKKILAFIEENNIDVIHVSWTKDLLLSALIKKFSSRHLKIIYYRQMKLTRKKSDIYHKFIYHKIDHVLAITEKLSSECNKYLPIKPDQIDILKYGIKKFDNKRYNKDEIYERYNLDKSKFTIGVFSRIEEQKGQHLLIEAMNLLFEKNIQLVIVGHCMDDDYKRNIEMKCSQYNLKDRVIFIPFIENPKGIMSTIDLIVLPTYEETFGLVVIEGMMSNTPVIGSDAGGVPEIITNEVNGLLFHTRSSSSLAEKIYSIYKSDELKNKIIKNADVYVRKEYDYNEHFKKFKDIVENKL